MTDIVERLRQVQGDNADAREAADEIERLLALSQNNAHSWDTVVRERDGLRADNERLRALVEELERELVAADEDGQYYPGIHKP